MEANFEPHFSEIEVLVQLGLTLKQARVYSALIKLGPSCVLKISKSSKVARPDVYLALSKLSELGLAEKIIRKPLSYSAIPLKNGITQLLNLKTVEYRKLRADTQILLEIDSANKKNEEGTRSKQVEAPQFVLIPEGNTVIERIRTAIETSQQSIDVVLSWKRFTRGITNDFADAIEKAWTRKVNVRFLIGGNADTETAKQLIGFCKEKPCCQTRFCSKYPEAIFGIYDKKELFVIVKSKTNLSGSAALWTINPSLVSIAKHYFEMLWRTAIEMN